MENTTAQTDSEINDNINLAAAATHDLMISSAGVTYGIATVTISTVVGQATYQLASAPISLTDFKTILRVAVVIDSVNYPIARIPLTQAVTWSTPLSWGPGFLPRYRVDIPVSGAPELVFDPPPDAINTVAIAYHVRAPSYSSDSTNVIFGGCDAAIDWLILDTVMRMKDKEQRTTASFAQERTVIEDRIRSWVGGMDDATPWAAADPPSQYGRAIWRRERSF